VFLNDWAAAVPLDKECPFFGALNFAADAVFMAYPAPVRGQASHDLEMIVKVMFACMHPAYFNRFFPKLDGLSKRADFTRAINTWNAVRQLTQWKALFDAAKRTDYVALQKLIQQYLPSVPLLSPLQQPPAAPEPQLAPATPATPVQSTPPVRSRFRRQHPRK